MSNFREVKGNGQNDGNCFDKIGLKKGRITKCNIDIKHCMRLTVITRNISKLHPFIPFPSNNTFLAKNVSALTYYKDNGD